MGIIKNECDQSGHETLKLTVFQNWTDELIFCMLVQIQFQFQIDSVIFGSGSFYVKSSGGPMGDTSDFIET